MTPEEAGGIDTERRLEEWREKEWEKKRRAPKSPSLLPLSKRPKSGKIKTFHITCEVPEEHWNALVKEGFKDNDLPDMLAGSICDIADQVGHVAPKFVER